MNMHELMSRGVCIIL